MNLKEIQTPVYELLEETTRILSKNVKCNIEVIDHIGDLAPVTKGKKIRSTLMFLLAGMVDAKILQQDLPEIAASLEMFHLSSLIHDDVVDNSKYRRGKETLQHNLGNSMTVLWGDYLFITAFRALNHLKRHFLMDIILDTAHEMVEGQIIELSNTFNFNIEEAVYYDVITKKTSSLFSAVTQIVAMMHTEDQQQQARFKQFGLDFGTIFQISDDMLDIFSDKSGKDRFSDLKEGKITLPFFMLQKACKKDLSAHYAEKDQNKLLALFDECHTKEMCMKVIYEYYQNAMVFINQFPDSHYKESMIHLLDFIKYRDY